MDLVAGVSRHLNGPMVVVTAASGDERAGCLVGFATQCSIEPARWLVCLSEKNATFSIACQAAWLAVHFLDRAGRPLAELFGGETDDEIDKFARCAWHEGPGGLPVLEECASWLAGPVIARYPLGDHAAFVVDVADGGVTDQWTPLGYQDVVDLSPGHAP